MRIFAVDPGPEQSALVVFDGARVERSDTLANQVLLDLISDRRRSSQDWLVVEAVVSYGMPVGAPVFETVFWSGRFVQSWTGYRAPLMPWARVGHKEAKVTLCHSMKAKDGNIRQALLDRFGPTRQQAIGTKKSPGPLYGVRGHEWSALAVAVTFWDQHHARLNAAESRQLA